jgi:transposase
MERIEELVRLHRLGTGNRRVAALLRMSPNTERQYRKALQAEGLLEGKPDVLPALAELRAAVEKHVPRKVAVQQTSSVQRWEKEIEEKLSKGARPQAIYDFLRLEYADFEGSLWAVKRVCRRLAKARPVTPEDVSIPVDTSAGEVLQVDFGYVGKLFDTVQRILRKAWVFVAVLGYSRHMFCRVVFDQKVETWLGLHVAAFESFGGVVETVVPDNLKSAVIRAAFGVNEEPALNRSYRELAKHYGFKIDPTPPLDPRKKGKVESGVKYVKRNFFHPRDLEEIGQANRELDRWVAETGSLGRGDRRDPHSRHDRQAPVGGLRGRRAGRAWRAAAAEVRAGGVEASEGPPGLPLQFRQAAVPGAVALHRQVGVGAGDAVLGGGLPRRHAHRDPPARRQDPARGARHLPAARAGRPAPPQPGVLGRAGRRPG